MWKGGKTLAAKFAKTGKKVVLIEQDPAMFGGTCINIGCVPTKTLLHDATASHSHQFSDDFYQQAMSRKRTLREKMNAANLAMMEKPGVLVVVAHAEFIDERKLKLTAGTDELEVTADQIIINTGATPVMTPITGLGDNPLLDPRVLTSTELIDRENLPRRLAVIGAGYIALELANISAHFGSSVTILNRNESILPHESEQTRATVEKILSDAGITFMHQTWVEKVAAPADPTAPLTIHTNHASFDTDALLIAIGRKPNIDGLNLAAAGIEVKNGAIFTDEFLRTTARNIWAVGDVNGGLQHTYISFDDHRIVADQLLHGKGLSGRSLLNRGAVPTTTFLTPPLSRVGLTAEKAKELAAENNWEVAIANREVSSLATMPRAKAVNDTRGFMEIVVDKKSEQILGATLFCIDSQELINLITLAMDHQLPYTSLRDRIYTHPATTEALNELLAEI
ncbi:FAD-dependent oxidoreductase [Arcanobacterium hippocoleae]